MKQLSCLLIALIGVIFLSSATAVGTNNIKVGVVDIQIILQHSPKVSKIKEKLKKQFSPQEEKIVAKQKSLNTMMAKMKRDGTVMLGSEKKQLEQKIHTEKKELTALINDFDKKFRTAQQEAMQTLSKEVSSTIQKIAKKNDLDIILPKAAVMYASDKLDLTEQVKKALN